MKRTIIKYRFEEARWHFFAYTKVGWKLAIWTAKLYDRYPNKVTAWLKDICLPF